MVSSDVLGQPALNCGGAGVRGRGGLTGYADPARTKRPGGLKRPLVSRKPRFQNQRRLSVRPNATLWPRAPCAPWVRTSLPHVRLRSNVHCIPDPTRRRKDAAATYRGSPCFLSSDGGIGATSGSAVWSTSTSQRPARSLSATHPHGSELDVCPRRIAQGLRPPSARIVRPPPVRAPTACHVSWNVTSFSFPQAPGRRVDWREARGFLSASREVFSHGHSHPALTRSGFEFDRRRRRQHSVPWLSDSPALSLLPRGSVGACAGRRAVGVTGHPPETHGGLARSCGNHYPALIPRASCGEKCW
ncbi:hypothetical protein BC628DRAFT_509504 [Trametes gibbosa]|nr:hypothetical protein BC628DRAFT_509504 [Trametes gibbosa]